MTPTSHFQVFQASAGAGKTFTVVKEYLKLCLASPRQTDNFRHILAITFTNAAANEMKAKIIGHLLDIINSVGLEPHTMEADLVDELGIDDDTLKHNAQLLLSRIIHDYSSFCVSTIDAFVQKLSRSFANELGLPWQYAVSVDTKEVSLAITENIGLGISETNDFLTQLLTDFSENNFLNQRSNDIRRQLSEFVEKLTAEKAYQGSETDELSNPDDYRDAAAFLAKKTVGFENETRDLANKFMETARRLGLQTDDFAYGKAGFVNFVAKTAQGDFGPLGSRTIATVQGNGKWHSATAGKRLSDGELDSLWQQLRPLLEDLVKTYETGFASYLFYKSQSSQLYLYALRAQIMAEFRKLANEEEVVHISEFNKLLQQVLGDFSVPFIYERIGERFRHLFIDEFQDTSVMQWQNLLPLIDNALSSGGTGMIVGDGKQSIYRFRSGEVGQIVQLPEIYALPTDIRHPAFKQYQQNLIDNFGFHDLKSNYRSFSNVVRFNNAFFNLAVNALGETSRKVYVDKSEKYKKEVSISQLVTKKNAGFVEIDLYDPEKTEGYVVGRIEELIETLTSEHGYCYGDITILTRNKELGSVIANHLNDKGIPVVSQVSVLLKSSAKVQLLVSVLRYLLNPGDMVAIAQLVYFWECCHNIGFQGDISGLFGSVQSVSEGSLPIETAMGIGPVGALRSALSKSTCLYDLCASLLRIFGLDAIGDAFVNYFLDEVFKWQSSSLEGMAAFLEYWEKKKNELAVKSVSDNAVNIMTIHKSKGLEFKVVIYPDAIVDLNEKTKKNAVTEVWVAPETLGFEPIPHLGKVLFKLDKKCEMMGESAMKLLQDEKESNRLDNINLLYVAFTRAVQRLYVIARQGKSTDPNLLRDFGATDKSELRNLYELDLVEDESDGVVTFRMGDEGFANPDTKPHDTPKEIVMDSFSTDWFGKVEIDPAPSVFWSSADDKMQPREWGNLVHQMLSKIQTPNDIDGALLPYLMDGTVNQDMADMLKDRFLQIAHHPAIAMAFDWGAVVKNECEILSGGEILRPDRYAELPDAIYLIDYKTGKEAPDHHTQLRNYVRALQGMVSKEIRPYLVYLSDPLEVEKVEIDTLF